MKTTTLHTQQLEIEQLYNEIEVDASPEEVWEKIATDFVHIGDFHSDMKYSYANDKTRRYGIGALRHCQINDKVFVKERITSWNAAQMTYSYEMYESEGTPIEFRQCTFSLIPGERKTRLVHEVKYRLKSGAKKTKKMQRENQKLLLIYRNYIEGKDFSKY